MLSSMFELVFSRGRIAQSLPIVLLSLQIDGTAAGGAVFTAAPRCTTPLAAPGEAFSPQPRPRATRAPTDWLQGDTAAEFWKDHGVSRLFLYGGQMFG